MVRDCQEISTANEYSQGKQFVTTKSSNRSPFMDALKVSPHGPTIILKRNPCDTYINPCNLDILHLWGGNVDLQHVTDEIATIMYVCSYMTKGKKAVGETLK